MDIDEIAGEEIVLTTENKDKDDSDLGATNDEEQTISVNIDPRPWHNAVPQVINFIFYNFFFIQSLITVMFGSMENTIILFIIYIYVKKICSVL